jgi:hypothetical protein
MLTTNKLHEAGQYCVELHNYYIQNYKTCQDIIVQFKDHHFLLGDVIFVTTFFDLYDLSNLDMLDISLMCCFALEVRKNQLLQYNQYTFYMCLTNLAFCV